MSYTKDEVIAKIIAVLKNFDGTRNPSVIMQKLNWNKDTISEICALFNVGKFSEILSQIPQIKMEKTEHGGKDVLPRLLPQHRRKNQISGTKKQREQHQPRRPKSRTVTKHSGHKTPLKFWISRSGGI